MQEGAEIAVLPRSRALIHGTKDGLIPSASWQSGLILHSWSRA